MNIIGSNSTSSRVMDTAVPYVISESPWSLTDQGKKAEFKLKASIYDLEAWGVLCREAQV